MRQDALVLTWISSGVNCASILMLVLCTILYFRSLNKELEMLRSNLSSKSFALFRIASQYQRCHFVRIIDCYSPTFVSMSTNLFLVSTWDASYKQLGWICVLINFTPMLITWIGYFVYKQKYSSRIKVTVNRANNEIGHLGDYRSTTHPQFNRVLAFQMNFYLTKRLLNESKRNQHKRRFLIWVYRVFHFYVNLAWVVQKMNKSSYAKKELIFSDQESQLTVEQMLQLIGDYFDKWDIEIKALKPAKKSKIKKKNIDLAVSPIFQDEVIV